MNFKALEAHICYTHSGEFFSKLLFLHATAEEYGAIVHIVPSLDIRKKYSLISQELSFPYQSMDSYHDLALLEEKNKGIYSISIDDMGVSLDPLVLGSSLILEVGKSLSMESLMQKLQDLSYEYGEYEKAGSYSRKGDILKIYYPHSGSLTINYWGEEIESLEENGHAISKKTLLSLQKFKNIDDGISLQEYLKKNKIFCVLDMLEFHPLYEDLLNKDFYSTSFNILGTQGESFPSQDLRISGVSCESLENFREILGNKKNSVFIYTRHSTMLEEFLKSNNLSHIKTHAVKSHLLTSFSKEESQGKKTIYLCDDVIQKIFIKRRVRKKLSGDIDLLLKIKFGDFVVHIDHGIGIFKGIVKKQVGKTEKEYMELSYKDKDKLFVPITEVHRVSKYVGKENPLLTPLSGKVWEKKMKKIHENIREIAEELLKNFAERKVRVGKGNLLDTQKLREFQESFPYSYTHDQEQAIEDIFSDMCSEKNMDRLLVGDVGFGKTEVAFNAAYLALLNKKQVLLISPLVVLAHEHYEKAQERFAHFGIKIEVLTRLQSQKHATLVIKGLQDGSIDMLIGTHRLLSDKVQCKRLGLMIVDEEHKFGVVDKEKIKKIKSHIDILSLSATPIPRSLNLALSGVRDISLLKTAPTGRKSIKTFVTRYNEKIIQEAGNKEFQRGGQVFFVHNRLSNIEVYKKQLQALFPKRKIIITHGQLPGDELEDRILDFKNKKYDILLSTTVIENGIDFSNVNTIFINECQSFGISQIHQLRGRVGRSHAQGYCYLLYRKEKLDGEAAKRIQTIVDYSYLGAGFELAMKDLEIRGGGDILGVKQSGQSQEIGISLFLKMLEEKIEELKKGTGTFQRGTGTEKTQIDLDIAAGVPDSYFLSETDKLHFYREIELVEDLEDLEYLKNSFLENTLTDKIPEEVKKLFCILECQIRSQKYAITHIKRVGINYQLDFHEGVDLDTLKNFLVLDKDVKFQVVNVHRLRSPIKGFENDEKFIEYLLRLLQGNLSLKRKIQLAKKRS